jgi:hypothetical protein
LGRRPRREFFDLFDDHPTDDQKAAALTLDLGRGEFEYVSFVRHARDLTPRRLIKP